MDALMAAVNDLDSTVDDYNAAMFAAKGRNLVPVARAKSATVVAMKAALGAMNDAGVTLVDPDIANYDAYVAYIRPIVKAAYADATVVGDVNRGSYYDITTYKLALPGVNAHVVRDILSANDGNSMYAYGSFGGYSTIGNVRDAGDGTVNVESVYHIGD